MVKIYLLLALVVIGIAIAACAGGDDAAGTDGPLATSSTNAYYGPEACNRLFDTDVDAAYCERDELGLERVETSLVCDTLGSEALRADCNWDRAIVTADAALCDGLDRAHRDICLWDVHVSRYSAPVEQTQAFLDSLEPPGAFAICERISDSSIRDSCLNRSTFVIPVR